MVASALGTVGIFLVVPLMLRWQDVMGMVLEGLSARGGCCRACCGCLWNGPERTGCEWTLCSVNAGVGEMCVALSQSHGHVVEGYCGEYGSMRARWWRVRERGTRPWRACGLQLDHGEDVDGERECARGAHLERGCHGRVAWGFLNPFSVIQNKCTIFIVV